MPHPDREQAVKSFIIAEFLTGREDVVDDDSHLLKLGIIDSISLVRLTGFIQDELGIEVPPTEVTPDNFKSIRSIVELLGRLRPA